MLDVYAGEVTISKPYNIRCIDARWNTNREVIIMRFEIVAPGGGMELKIEVVFSREFIEDFYELSSVHPINSFLDSHRMDFLWWSWVKTKEQIDAGTLTPGEILVCTKDNDDKPWAESAKQNLDSQICEDLLSKNGYHYSPEKRIGFLS